LRFYRGDDQTFVGLLQQPHLLIRRRLHGFTMVNVALAQAKLVFARADGTFALQ
jgi:hypothetical protein